MARHPRRCRCRAGAAAVAAAGAVAALWGLSGPAAFAASGPAARGAASHVGLVRPQQAGCRFAGSAADIQVRNRKIARRLFDTGSFFGVGVPEAIVVGLLGWFLLGPEELYRLAKGVGGWLGELRTFVGQAAQQYESALDDESTRKAIDGIRSTQKTVAEVAGQWRSVADNFRDPLNLSNTFAAALDKYDSDKEKDKDKDKEDKDAAKDSKKASGKKADAAKKYPDLTADGDFEDLEETEDELEAKKAASKKAAEDLWFSGKNDAEEGPISARRSERSLKNLDLPRDPEGYLERLDERLDELEEMAVQLEDLRTGIKADRNILRQAMADKAEAKAAVDPKADAVEGEAAVDPKAEAVKAEAVKAEPVASGGVA